MNKTNFILLTFIFSIKSANIYAYRCSYTCRASFTEEPSSIYIASNAIPDQACKAALKLCYAAHHQDRDGTCQEKKQGMSYLIPNAEMKPARPIFTSL